MHPAPDTNARSTPLSDKQLALDPLAALNLTLDLARGAPDGVNPPSIGEPRIVATSNPEPRDVSIPSQLSVTNPTQANSKYNPSSTFDKVGIGLSVLCAFKCMGVPIVATVFSLGGLAAYAHHPVAVWTVAGLALPVAAWRLIAKEIQNRRFVTPLAATVASGAVFLGAVGHTLPPSDAALSGEGGCCCGMSEVDKSSLCCPPSEHTQHEAKVEGAPVALVQNEDLPLYEKVRSNAHQTLLLGALALGFLHLNLLGRDYVMRRRSGPCGKSKDNCSCPT